MTFGARNIDRAPDVFTVKSMDWFDWRLIMGDLCGDPLDCQGCGFCLMEVEITERGTSGGMEITSTGLLASLWRGRADSIMRQLDFVKSYPDGPMREVKTLRQCAAQLEAAGKSRGLDAVLHLANDKISSGR